MIKQEANNTYIPLISLVLYPRHFQDQTNMLNLQNIKLLTLIWVEGETLPPTQLVFP